MKSGAPESCIESTYRDAEPGLGPGSDTGRGIQNPGELRREIEALRDRISQLNAAILRISVSLDVSAVLHEVVERARSLSQFGSYIRRSDVLVPCGGFGSWPELNNCTLSGFAREDRSETRKGRQVNRHPCLDHYHE